MPAAELVEECADVRALFVQDVQYALAVLLCSVRTLHFKNFSFHYPVCRHEGLSERLKT